MRIHTHAHVRTHTHTQCNTTQHNHNTTQHNTTQPQHTHTTTTHTHTHMHMHTHTHTHTHAHAHARTRKKIQASLERSEVDYWCQKRCAFTLDLKDLRSCDCWRERGEFFPPWMGQRCVVISCFPHCAGIVLCSCCSVPQLNTEGYPVCVPTPVHVQVQVVVHRVRGDPLAGAWNYQTFPLFKPGVGLYNIT